MIRLAILVLAFFLALPVVAAPRDDARALLDWLHATRDNINRDGKAKDKVALQRWRREAQQKLNAWPDNVAHAEYMNCRTALVDMVEFLDAYQRKDYAWRERKGKHFRKDLADCERAVAGKW